MEPIITLENVTKQFKILNRHEGLKGSIKDLFSRDYKTITAVDNVTMNVMPGEIVGYLGTNGAGKSTTIKMMTGVLKPTSGIIRVNGKIPYENRTQNAQNIGVVFGQRSQLWWSLPLVESLKLLRDMYQIPQKQYEETLALYESLVNIKDLYRKPVRQMSLGQRTLSDILASFLHNPSVVFLDEPTIGLDVSMKGKIRELIQALNKEKGTTVILTTHDMGDVDALCRRIVLIDKGKMLYDDSIEKLHNIFGAYRTLKVKFSKTDGEITKEELKKIANEMYKALCEYFGGSDFQVNVSEDWVSILVHEDKTPVMQVLPFIESKQKVYDIKIEEISTESVVKKIYEGGI